MNTENYFGIIILVITVITFIALALIFLYMIYGEDDYKGKIPAKAIHYLEGSVFGKHPK